MTVRRDPRLFDKAKPLVMARFVDLHQHEMSAGEALHLVDEQTEDRGAITLGLAVRLWTTGVINYGRAHALPTDHEESPLAALVKIEDLGGDLFLISAPWLARGVEVQGRDGAETRRTAIIEKGDTKGVAIDAAGDGRYAISAPWLEDFIMVEGEESAIAREAELIEAGPPEGWRMVTPEEREAAAEQAHLREEANRIAQEEADKDAERDKAVVEEARKRHREEAEMDARAGFIVTPGAGGWFEISGSGLDKPVKVQGSAAAAAKVEEMVAAALAETDGAE